ncbi:MAG: hypothetical protein EXS42_02140 [Lacunisphaera sp.]|nr:hypothetical protein [Lacunisphaera sp.]
MSVTLKHILGTGLLILAVQLPAAELPPDSLLAHYNFNGSGTDETGRSADWELVNTEFREDSLFLNGRYEYYKFESEKGYRAVVAMPVMNPRQFTLVLRFKTSKQHKGAKTLNLITASTGHRWFGLAMNGTEGGKLLVKFNNGDVCQRIERASCEWKPGPPSPVPSTCHASRS